MPKININDIEMYYEKHGEGEPIVFIPGFSANHLLWTSMLNYLTATNTVVLLDNRGAGKTDAPDMPYSVEMMADDIAALCHALHLESCHFVGSSMGCAIAQTLAVKYPALCKSIVLTNPFTKIDIRFALFAQARYQLMLSNTTPRTQIEAMLGWLFSPNYLEQPNMIETLISSGLSDPCPMTPIGYHNQLSALLNFDSSAWISDINKPCLIIAADQDLIVQESHMRDLANKIAGANYYCFDNVGHLPPVEKPLEYSQVVLQFIKEIS